MLFLCITINTGLAQLSFSTMLSSFRNQFRAERQEGSVDDLDPFPISTNTKPHCGLGQVTPHLPVLAFFSLTKCRQQSPCHLPHMRFRRENRIRKGKVFYKPTALRTTQRKKVIEHSDQAHLISLCVQTASWAQSDPASSCRAHTVVSFSRL